MGVVVLPGWFRTTSGLLPDNTGSPWEMSSFGGGDKPSLLFSIAIMWLSSFGVDIYNFMIDTALSLIVLHTELVHFSNDTLKDTGSQDIRYKPL